MGIIQRQSITGFIYTGLGVLLGFVVTGLMQPKIFQTDEIGLLRVIISYASIMSTFALLGFSVVSVKVFPTFRDKKSKHHGFFGLAILLGIFGFVLASLIYVSFQHLILKKGIEESPLFTQFFYLVIPLTFFLTLYSVIDTYFRILYQAVIGIVYRDIIQRILVFTVFVLFYFNYINFTENVYFYVLAYSLPAVFMLISLLRRYEYGIIPDFKFLTKPLLKEIGHIGLFGIFSSFSGILVINIDILMLNHMQGLSQTGIYTITFFFGALVLVPSRSLVKISSVIIADAFKRNDLKEIESIYKKSSINLGIIGMLILLGLWGNLDNIFKVIGEEFLPGMWVIILIGSANLIDMLLGISNQIFFNSKYYTISAYLSFFFMVLLVLTNLIMIPMYGIIGAAIASLSSKLIYNLIKYVYLYKKFGFQPFTKKTLLLMVLGFLTISVFHFLPHWQNYLIDLAIRSILITVFFSIGVLILNLSEDVNAWVLKMKNLIVTKLSK
ncbi:MAG: polysaccharide biosynthesis C-terminal domain-containing protein [Bacteroidales bacterium]|nr:polysaccharide biosynthesis C-terminal domain-containing protein [Bacteroidales bacterium]